MLNFHTTCLFLVVHRVFCDIVRVQGWNYINLHCRDNNNVPVDWWFIYKPPSDAGPYLESGRNFSFITPDSGGKWESSDRHITGNSMLQHTLSPMYRPTYRNYLATLAYHTKEGNQHSQGSSALGIMMADELGGVWIGHSVPGLPDLNSHRPIFPQEEIKNGHLLLCLSLDLVTLNEITDAIKAAEPMILRMRVPSAVRELLPSWQDIHEYVPPTNDTHLQKLDFDTFSRSLRATMMVRRPGDTTCLYKTFAKKKKIVLDVYGHDTKTRSVCGESFSMRNMDSISLKNSESVYYINNKTDRINFAVSTAAHWQRTGRSAGTGASQFWTCTSTLEKEEVSGKGGLILCVEDYNVWRSFDNLKVKEPEC